MFTQLHTCTQFCFCILSLHFITEILNSLQHFQAFSVTAHLHICELPKTYLEFIFTHPLNLECPSTFGTLSLVDLLWQVFSDLIMTADAQTFSSLLAISGYLFSLFSLWNVPMLNSPLLTNRCHSGMNCRELSPEIGKTATEALWMCEG